MLRQNTPTAPAIAITLYVPDGALHLIVEMCQAFGVDNGWTVTRFDADDTFTAEALVSSVSAVYSRGTPAHVKSMTEICIQVDDFLSIAPDLINAIHNLKEWAVGFMFISCDVVDLRVSRHGSPPNAVHIKRSAGYRGKVQATLKVTMCENGNAEVGVFLCKPVLFVAQHFNKMASSVASVLAGAQTQQVPAVTCGTASAAGSTAMRHTAL
eukprot:3933129-Rhodomonas_salina.1